SVCDFLYALDKGKLALAGPAKEILPRLFGGKAPEAMPEPAPEPKAQTKKEAKAKPQLRRKPAATANVGNKGPGATEKSALAKEIAEKAAVLARKSQVPSASANAPKKLAPIKPQPATPRATKPAPRIEIGAKRRPNTAQILKAWNEGKPLPIKRKNGSGGRVRAAPISRSTPRLRNITKGGIRPGTPAGE
ncbi:MAG: hypothetical protein KAR80_04510, partial [Rhodospirillaceae bacterium]|nr:hypothetical protein [Rhodospirillaceae bacterium]